VQKETILWMGSELLMPLWSLLKNHTASTKLYEIRQTDRKAERRSIFLFHSKTIIITFLSFQLSVYEFKDKLPQTVQQDHAKLFIELSKFQLHKEPDNK